MEPSAQNKHEKCETFYVNVHYWLGTVGSTSSQTAWWGTGGLTEFVTPIYIWSHMTRCAVVSKVWWRWVLKEMIILSNKGTLKITVCVLSPGTKTKTVWHSGLCLLLSPRPRSIMSACREPATITCFLLNRQWQRASSVIQLHNPQFCLYCTLANRPQNLFIRNGKSD